MHDKKIYGVWEGFIQRCTNKNNPRYENYGGRGIDVSEDWLKFKNFYNDMGDPPPNLTLDRKDNDKGYSKENCRWATLSQQGLNKQVAKKSKTGITGVGWYKARSKWTARLTVNRSTCNLGYFNDFFEACCARKSKENKVRLA